MKTLPLVTTTLCLAVATAGAADERDIPAGRYRVETRMLMPHLDQMRGKSERFTACVAAGDAAAFFPVLRQPGLKACSLEPDMSDRGTLRYRLRCPGPDGAHGKARLFLRGDTLRGELDATMGGKNMTYSQTFNAVREGDCG